MSLFATPQPPSGAQGGAPDLACRTQISELASRCAEVDVLALDWNRDRFRLSAVGHGAADNSFEMTVDLTWMLAGKSRTPRKELKELFAPLVAALETRRPSLIVAGDEGLKRAREFVDILQIKGLALVNPLAEVARRRPDLSSPTLVAAAAEILGRTSHPSDPHRRELDNLCTAAEIHARFASCVEPSPMRPEQTLIEIMRSRNEQLQFIRALPDAHLYFFQRARAEQLTELLRKALEGRIENNTASISVPYAGTASMRVRTEPRVDSKALDELVPGLAREIGTPSCTKDALKLAFRRRGLSAQVTSGIVDGLYDPSGITNPVPSAFPKWALLYRSEALNPAEPRWTLHSVIRKRSELKALATRLAKAKVFSIDTETWGPEGEPLDRDLCWIQIGVRDDAAQPENGEVYLVCVSSLEREFGALKSQGRVKADDATPIDPLKGVLEREDIVKIAHHAQFEEGQFRKYGITLMAAQDTKKLVRALRPDMPSVTLQACCREILGVYLSKDEQTSAWQNEELTPSQLAYAALDAEYTFRLWDRVQLMCAGMDIAPDLTAEELLRELAVATAEARRAARTLGIGADYFMREATIAGLEELLKEQLRLEYAALGGAVVLTTDHGTLVCKPRAQSTLSVERLRAEHPAVAEEVLSYEVQPSDLRKALEEARMQREEIESILGHVCRPHVTWRRFELDLDLDWTYEQPQAIAA